MERSMAVSVARTFALLVAVGVAGSASAETAAPSGAESEAFAASEPSAGSVPSRVPESTLRRARVADPWFTRGTVAANGGVVAWSTTMAAPGGEPIPATGSASAAGISVDLHGRRLAFALGLSGSATDDVASPIEGAAGTPARFTAGEARAAFDATILNARGIYVAAGAGIEARASAYGSFDQGNELVTSWQTVVAGADLRARVFAGPRVYFAGSLFAGAVPVALRWQRVDAAGTDPLSAGSLEDPFVLAASAGVGVRPVEWLALAGGVVARDASYRLDDGSEAREQCIRPYVGIELLY